jgi:hypothetical protein
VNKSLSPTMIGAAAVVMVLVLAGAYWFTLGGGAAGGSSSKPAGMPPSVAAEFNKRMSQVSSANDSKSHP